ncbi:hypothetical protein ACL03H_19325 [Saccharopolyspora sp. MS10]|uniref:sunset domain-containing protein n=1 Tax=Saccharopolyspora sp. MS10 TaxID=3385973 RepID=UPI0039A33B4A
MVWLFTQVWLWSIAGFLLGSVITWLLSALPLRRRLRRVTSEFTEYVEQQDAQRDRQVWRAREAAQPAVERTTVQPRWEQLGEDEPERTPAPPEPTTRVPEPTARIPEPVDDSRAEVSVRGGSQTADLVVNEGRSEPARPGQEQASPVAPARSTGAWKEDQSAYAGRSSGGWWPSRAHEDESAQDAAAQDAPSDALGKPGPWTIPADHETADEGPATTDIGQALGRASTDPVADRPAESASTWFQKNAESDEGAPATETTAQQAPARSGPPGLSGAAELSAALGLSDLSRSPKPAAEAPAERAPEPPAAPRSQPAPESPAAPERQPAAGAEPEPAPAAPEAEPVRAEQPQSEHGFAGNLRALVESRAHEFVDVHTEQPEIPVVAESEQTPLPRRTPGAGPRPGMSTAPARPSGAAWHADPQAQANRRRESLAAPQEPSQQEGRMIKGDFSSRRYHSPESPHYDRIVAEVWFRTPADAEEAGFTAWNA